MQRITIKRYQTASRDGTARRGSQLASQALAAVGLLALGTASAAMSAAALASLRRAPADLDGAVAALAALATAAVLLVWCLGAATTALSLLVRATSRTAGAGRLSRSLHATGTALTPALLRRLVVALLGATTLTGLAGPALATPATPDLTWPAATATATPATATPTPGAAAPAANGAAVVVGPGDTLWRIAERDLPAGARPADVAAAWPRWFAANRDVIGADPDRLRPGQRLVAPSARSTP